MLKKVSKISDYSVFDFFTFFQFEKISYVSNYQFFDFFTFFFQSKKISFTFSCVSFSSFFSLKRFLIYLIMLFSIFLSFSSLELFILVYCENKYLRKIKVHYTPLKAFGNTIFKVIHLIFKQYLPQDKFFFFQGKILRVELKNQRKCFWKN